MYVYRHLFSIILNQRKFNKTSKDPFIKESI